MHTHILPGIDDGSQTIEQTANMLRTAYDEGIRVIVATPHFGIRNPGITLSQAKDALEAAQNFYYGQPDREKLASALPYVEDCIGSSENEREYVSHASLPYYAILTDEGWFSQVRGSYYMGIIAEPLSDKEWLKLQIELVKRATSIPDYKAYILTTRI